MKYSLFDCLVYKRIRQLEEELEALGGGDEGGETTRSNVIKTPNLTPRKVCHYLLLHHHLSCSFFRMLHLICTICQKLKTNYLVSVIKVL